MDDFPNNSRKAKSQVEMPEDHPTPEVEVIEGVIVSKPSRWKRLRKSLIVGDVSSATEHVFWNLLLPSTKDILLDLGTTFLELMIRGEQSSPLARRGIPTQGLGSTSKINYGGVSSGGSKLILSSNQNVSQPTASKRFSPDDIYVTSKAQGREIIARLLDAIEQYNVVTVANLYALVGVTPDYVDYKWGWNNIDSADVRRERDGTLKLILPAPMDLGS